MQPAVTEVASQERFVVRAIRQYCQNHGLTCEVFSDGWVVRVAGAAQVHFLYGYDLGLNPSSVSQICKDKAATWDLLSYADVAAVTHRLFSHPDTAALLSQDSVRTCVMDTFQEFGEDVVVKPNKGTSGKFVSRVDNVAALELACQEVWRHGYGLALSPFIPARREVRVYLLDGEPLLTLSKTTPTVRGDGSSGVDELAAAQLEPALYAHILSRNPDIKSIWAARPVPAKNQEVGLLWKGNLALGARSELVEPEELALEVCCAQSAAAALQLRFGSVDLLCTGDEVLVLEVNDGVMLESLVRQHQEGESLAQEVYFKALDALFRAS